MNSSNIRLVVVGLVIGIALTVLSYELLKPSGTMEGSTSSNEPLYWVAPMDPNYRRDKPGKSPMGMDLVPVYENQSSGTDEGIVTISPQIVNNLGVRTALARYGELNQEIKTVGYVQYNENNVMHTHPRVEGWIDKLYVKANGERVEKDAPLYALYSPELVNAQEEFLVAQRSNNQRLLAAAKSRLEALQMPSANIQQLMRKGTVQQTITFNAPQSGVVERLNIREGFYVEPSTTMMSIADLSSVWVDVDVFERQSHLLRDGMRVELTHSSIPARVWLGEVDYIYPTIDSMTRTQRARVKFQNDDGALKPGMFADIKLYASMASHTLVIPRNAVIRTERQDRVVLALGDGRFKSVAVTLGHVGQELAQVLSGVETGQAVVTHAQFLIDSESNRDVEVTRMSEWSPEMMKVPLESATVVGTINNVDANSNKVNISRGPITKWNRPAGTLDFVMGSGINVSEFIPGNSIEFTFEIHDGEFVIVAYRLIDANGVNSQ
ncbi:efflux RND transporter periplasmic adaptor subunit [Alteromonadaceae bacterium M269]|nr:efflux RND transporter periplasmic adaptor subunit [Alteromonadaceae bacterium M269]